jgi:hypothetical protein
VSGVKIFGREPTLWLAVINAVVMLVGTVGLNFLDNDQAGLIVAAINAVFGAINAYAVRPISPAVFTYAVGSILSLGAAYGVNVTSEQLMAINSTVIVVLGLLTRGQVAPVESAVSRASDALAKPEVDAT